MPPVKEIDRIMKVYIIIKTERYESGYAIFTVCASKELALKEVEKIITSDIWRSDGWEYDSFEEGWVSERHDLIEIVEKEVLEN